MHITKDIDTIFHRSLEGLTGDDHSPESRRDFPMSQSSGCRNGTDATVCHIFERIASQFPESVAAEDGGRNITYGELHYASNHLANHLSQIGIQSGQKIVIISNRSLEMIVALLGIMKSGACVVPIDFETWSQDRIQTTLETTQCRYAISTKCIEIPNQELILFQEGDLQHVLDNRRDQPASFSTRGFQLPSADDLAYTIFTSGTTSKPKGVMVPHSAIAHYVQQVSDEAPFNLNVQASSRVLLVFSVAFDACLGVVLSTICNGGTLILATSMNFATVATTCTILPLTPTILSTLRPGAEYDSIKSIFLGGESPSPNLLRPWLNGERRIFNCYGPTETTCTSLIKEVLPDEPNHLRYTVAGSSVVLLDGNLREVSEGEIAISGPGLAVGYFNNQALTAEKFIVYKGVRHYLTGDYGRKTSFGIDFLGRKDRVVKNRGFLINLEAEVEAVITNMKLANSAAALMHEGRLIMFVTPETIDVSSLRSRLLEIRDSFLVPDRIYAICSFPITSNGKVDLASLRQLLQEEKFTGVATHQSSPSSNLYVVLEGFSKVLGLPPSALCGSSSFLDNGGNSLSAVSLASHLRERGLSITVREIFESDTAQRICDTLSATILSTSDSEEADLESLRENVVRAGYPLTPRMEVAYMTAIQVNMIQSTIKMPSMNYIQLSITFDLSSGLFKPEVFRRAWEIIVQRHSILRATFIPALEATVIAADPTMDWREQLVDSSEWDSAVADAREKILCSMAPLDAEYLKPRSIFRLITEPKSRTEFIWTIHHSLVDGWSIAVIMRDLQCILSQEELPKVAQFTSVATVQKALAQRSLSRGKQQSWEEKMQNYIPAPRLRLPKPQGWARAARAERRQLLGVHRSQVQRFVQEYRVSDASIFLASWALVLSKYLSTDRVLFGVVLSGRNLPMAAVDQVVGPLLDTVPFPVNTTSTQSTAEFLRTIHGTLHEMNESPWEMKLQKSSMGPESLETLVALQYDLPDSTWNVDPKTWPSPQSMKHNETTELPLHILIDMQNGGDLEARYLYDCSHFEAAMIDQMLSHFSNMLKAILMHPTVELVKSSMMNQLEINDLLYSSPHMHDAYDGPQSLKQAFEEVVDTWPDAIAVESVSDSISYKELDHRSSAISNALLPLVGPGQIVGILSDGSVSWITAILAVLKAGAAYCPIDIALPEERIKVMLRESRCSLLLCTTEDLCELWANHSDLTCFSIGRLLSETLQTPERLPERCSPHDPAAVIFTSGSTGVPKGILLEHIGILSLLDFPNARLRSGPGRRNAQFLSLGFDCCVNEVFATLCYGATLVLRDPLDPVQHIKRVHATMCTPSFLATLDVNDFPNLELIALAGEPVPQKLVDTWGHNRVLLNVYSPSECTISTVYPQLYPGVQVTLGSPVPRQAIYILDKDLNPVPVGVPGEICISGIQVTRGYLNRPEETLVKFLPNPFQKGWRLYRSGDLGRLTNSHEIEYIGRIDNQVKVRGFRIELEEIESTIAALNPEVRQAAVIVVNDVLIGFVTPSSLDTLAIQAIISRHLPSYCRPSYFVALDNMPMSSNQKIDRKKLVSMKAERNHFTKVPIEGTTERIIQEIWKDLIPELGEVSALDNFLQIGGHSLLQARLTRQLGMALGNRIPLRIVIQNPVLRDLALAIDKHILDGGSEDISRGQPEQNTVLSHLEEEMYTVHMLSSEPSAWNIPYIARLTGPLNLAAFEASWNNIIRSNSILRARYQIKDGILTRSISTSISPVTRRYCKVTDDALLDIVNRAFDLANDQPIRLDLCLDRPTMSYVVLNMSHMIGDRSTMGEILRLLEEEYAQMILNDNFNLHEPLSESLPYSVWTAMRRKREVDAGLTHVLQKSLNPSLINPPLFGTFKQELACSAHRDKRIEGDLFSSLKNLRGRFKASGHQLAIAAVGLTLHRLSHREDFIIAAPIEDRTEAGTENMFGLFLDRLLIPLRFNLHSPHSADDLIHMVKSASEQAMANYIPFADLKNVLGMVGKSHSLCEIMVTYHASDLQGPNLTGVDALGIPVQPKGVKFPLMLEFSEFPESIGIDLAYDSHAIDNATMDEFEVQLMAAFRYLADETCSSTCTTYPPRLFPLIWSQKDTNTVAPISEDQEMIDLVREAMAECVGLNRCDISCSRSFFELGGSSVDCLRLQDRLIKSGVSVSLSSIIHLQTAELIAGAVE